MSIRPVISKSSAQPTMEGAGVHLHRAFGFGDPSEADPFLLFDDFRNERPQDYLKGFPWHPHRGIETITYVLSGTVEHGDSLGNRGLLGAGDEVTVQAGDAGIRFLLISGAPLEEPVAWHGPIVMNTREELVQAMAELRNGTFIKPAH